MTNYYVHFITSSQWKLNIKGKWGKDNIKLNPKRLPKGTKHRTSLQLHVSIKPLCFFMLISLARSFLLPCLYLIKITVYTDPCLFYLFFYLASSRDQSYQGIVNQYMGLGTKLKQTNKLRRQISELICLVKSLFVSLLNK